MVCCFRNTCLLDLTRPEDAIFQLEQQELFMPLTQPVANGSVKGINGECEFRLCVCVS